MLNFIAFAFLAGRYLYWITSSFETKVKGVGKIFLSQTIEGVLLFAIFLQIVNSRRIFAFHTTDISQAMGLALVASGVYVSIWAKKTLGKEWVYAADFRQKKNNKLLNTGPYSSIRHPIYTGIVISYIGIELLLGSWLWISCFFLFIPAYFQAKREEVLLLKHFGKKYEEYQKQTKMLIPWIF